MNVLDLFRLEGQVALVTGAGGGIGRAIAVALADAGANVAVVDLIAEGARTTALTVESLGRQGLALYADVTSEANVAAMVADTVATFGRLDIVVANAGVAEKRLPLVDASLAEWQRVIDVNLTGVFLTAREAARVMVPRHAGRIIATASIYGFVAESLSGGETRAYASAKAGVVNLVRSLAIELAPHNIRVNAIAPTYTRTGLGRGLLLGQTDEGRRLIRTIEQGTPLGRIGEPDDVRGAAVFLASAASSMMTGHTIVLDGGWLAW